MTPMVEPPWQLVSITGADDDPALLRRVYDEVLRPSFVPDELPSMGYVAEGFATLPFQLVLVAVADDDRPLAAAVYSEDGTGVGVLGYLAARPGERGRGTGAGLVQHLRSVWAGRPVEVVLGEVHDPRFHPETDADRAVARMRFYERWGARLLDVPWMQPRLTPGGHRVRNMVLLAFHLAAAAEEAGAVASAPVAAFVERYYVEHEGRVPDDPAYQALWRRFTARPTIAVGPIAGLDGLAPLTVPGGEIGG